MKKSFKLLAVAAIASLTIVACNNNKPAEEEIDSTPIEEIVEDEVIAEPVAVADTTPATVEEQVTKVAKKAVKKASNEVITKLEDNTIKEEVKPATKEEINTEAKKSGKTSMKPKF